MKIKLELTKNAYYHLIISINLCKHKILLKKFSFAQLNGKE